MSALRILGSGEHLRLVRGDDGWEHVERLRCSSIAVLVAVTDAGDLLLVEQFRPPVRRRVIELPAGLAGDMAGHEDETLETAARRELLEETGYEARSLTALTEGPPSAGLSSELVTFLRADGLRRVGPGGGDANESIELHEVPLATVFDWLADRAARGALIDPKVYAGLLFAQRPA